MIFCLAMALLTMLSKVPHRLHVADLQHAVTHGGHVHLSLFLKPFQL